MSVLWTIGCVSLAIWIVLLVGRGGFWLPRPRLHPLQQPVEGQQDISVAAVIPARNEEDILSQTLPTVLGQDFAGKFRVILVDDRSEDGTADIAQQVAEECGLANKLTNLLTIPIPCVAKTRLPSRHESVHFWTIRGIVISKATSPRLLSLCAASCPSESLLQLT